jgi:hypothetical protein
MLPSRYPVLEWNQRWLVYSGQCYHFLVGFAAVAVLVMVVVVAAAAISAGGVASNIELG